MPNSDVTIQCREDKSHQFLLAARFILQKYVAFLASEEEPSAYGLYRAEYLSREPRYLLSCFLSAPRHIHLVLRARNNVKLHREDGQLSQSESSARINETRIWCRDYRIWLWRWSSGKSNGSSREERRGARTWLGKKMYGSRGFNQNTITNIPIAGSFPLTFSQCLKDTSILGSTTKSSFISKWLSSRDPTRLFQVFLGDGQHSFAAHGRWNSCPQNLWIAKSNSFFSIGIIGLGGSSLINAGVFLKADERTLQMSPWPSEIKDDPSTLDECELSLHMDNISQTITKCRLHTRRNNAATFHISG